MVSTVQVSPERLIEPQGAAQARRLVWEAHFQSAASSDTPEEAPTRPTKNAEQAVRRSAIAEVGRDPEPGDQRSVLRQARSRAGGEGEFARLRAQKSYARWSGSGELGLGKAEELRHDGAGPYRSVCTRRPHWRRRVGGRIWLRLLKRKNRGFRLGVIIYGASREFIRMIRNWVGRVAEADPSIDSGYVNGVECSRSEEKNKWQ